MKELDDLFDLSNACDRNDYEEYEGQIADQYDEKLKEVENLIKNGKKWNEAKKEGLVFGDKEWVLDSIYELKQENKKLKSLLDEIQKIYESPLSTNARYYHHKLKQIIQKYRCEKT